MSPRRSVRATGSGVRALRGDEETRNIKCTSRGLADYYINHTCFTRENECRLDESNRIRRSSERAGLRRFRTFRHGGAIWSARELEQHGRRSVNSNEEPVQALFEYEISHLSRSVNVAA